MRQERAEILGKSDFADVALARRMAGKGSKADEFVDEILNKALPFCKKRTKNWKFLKQKNWQSNGSTRALGGGLLV